eukprot:NODE_4457_length_805_cov_21.174603_g4123_i0.p2 GENE.NODE_4457_length_805_cov_21.174603_g4123_i0~~NODE_4457_length_805_cov_21.174603_g4123_i0.p2  ORF type:complete len:148 (-),score=23.90 NODE_4457_length_805_cov_21.174603_g4123_i0:172-615(-)
MHTEIGPLELPESLSAFWLGIAECEPVRCVQAALRAVHVEHLQVWLAWVRRSALTRRMAYWLAQTHFGIEYWINDLQYRWANLWVGVDFEVMVQDCKDIIAVLLMSFLLVLFAVMWVHLWELSSMEDKDEVSSAEVARAKKIIKKDE